MAGRRHVNANYAIHHHAQEENECPL